MRFLNHMGLWFTPVSIVAMILQRYWRIPSHFLRYKCGKWEYCPIWTWKINTFLHLKHRMWPLSVFHNTEIAYIPCYETCKVKIVNLPDFSLCAFCYEESAQFQCFETLSTFQMQESAHFICFETRKMNTFHISNAGKCSLSVFWIQNVFTFRFI